MDIKHATSAVMELRQSNMNRSSREQTEKNNIQKQQEIRMRKMKREALDDLNRIEREIYDF